MLQIESMFQIICEIRTTKLNICMQNFYLIDNFYKVFIIKILSERQTHPTGIIITQVDRQQRNLIKS